MGSGWHLSINHDPNGKNKRQSKYPQPPNCSKLCFDDKNFIISYFKSTDVKAFPFENNIAMAHYTRMLLLLLLSCFSRVRLCAAPEMAAHQAPLSLGFSKREHWRAQVLIPGCVLSRFSHAHLCDYFSLILLCDPVDRSLPGVSVHGVLQTRILE